MDLHQLQRDFNEHYARNLDEALHLLTRHVVVFGLGAVGGFCMSSLAHHGCRLVGVDRDLIEPANQARHVLSDPRYVGKPKAWALEKQLRSELPTLQTVRCIDADINGLGRAQLESLFAEANLVIAATGRDEIDRVLDEWARQHRIPILFPSLWAGQGAVLGDLHVVAWNLPNRRGACFNCLRPLREGAPPPADAQPGSRSDVMRVASLTTEVALALLTETPIRAGVMRNIERGANYFLIPRWPPTLRPVLTHRRRGCEACAPRADAAARPAAAEALTARDWAVGGALASAVLWHQLVPGLDAIATVAFIAVLGLWWRDRLASFAEVSARIRLLFGRNR